MRRRCRYRTHCVGEPIGTCLVSQRTHFPCTSQTQLRRSTVVVFRLHAQLTPSPFICGVISGDSPFPFPAEVNLAGVDATSVALEFGGLFEFLLPSTDLGSERALSPSPRAMSKAIALLKQLPTLVSVASADLGSAPSKDTFTTVREQCKSAQPVLLDVVAASEAIDDVITPLLVEPTADVFGVFADLLTLTQQCMVGGSGAVMASLLLTCELLDVLSVNLARLTAANVKPADYGIGVGTLLSLTHLDPKLLFSCLCLGCRPPRLFVAWWLVFEHQTLMDTLLGFGTGCCGLWTRSLNG
jgi:hypothetical protein